MIYIIFYIALLTFSKKFLFSGSALHCSACHSSYLGPKKEGILSVHIYLTKCRLVNALSHENPVEEASGTRLSGLALSLHRSSIMPSKDINSVSVENFYSSLSHLCIPMFFSNTSLYVHVYIGFVISVSIRQKTVGRKCLD